MPRPTFTLLDSYDGDGTTESTTALSGTSPGTYDALVVIGGGWGAGLTLTSWDSDIAGTALTQLAAGQLTGGNQWSSIHVIYSDETGYPTGTFTADLDLSGNAQLRAALIGVTDIDMTLAVAARSRTSGTGNSSSGVPSLTVASGATLDVIVGAVGFYSTQPTAEAGELFHADNGAASSSFYGWTEDGDGATTTIELDNSSSYHMSAVSFIGASASSFTLVAESGTFNLTGTDADLDVQSTLDAESGTFTLTGTDAALNTNLNLVAESGSFALTGTDAGLNLAYYMEALMGVITMTAPDVDLSVGNVLAAESGAFTLTGTDAALIADVVMTADSGSFALTGTDAALYTDLSLVAETGVFSLTGTDALLSASYLLDAETGTFTLTGTDAEFIADLTLIAETGTFTLTGTDVVLFVPGLAVRAARHTQSPVIRRHTISH